MRPIVAVLSDFGTHDHYVGAMKGAVLAACRDATVVDIAHDVPAHDVDAAALLLESAIQAFPAGTVFLAVVDPGVGTERRGLAAEWGGYRFVAPDNGVLTPVLEGAVVHSITNAGLFRYRVSPTFHGRDVFGPVAGHLARGTPLAEVGPAVTDALRIPELRAHRLGDDEWEALVVHVDRFGNLITSLREAELQTLLERVRQDPTEVVASVEGAVVPLVRTYGEVPEGEACALLGSSGRLEVAVNQGNAAEVMGVGRGARVRVRIIAQD